MEYGRASVDFERFMEDARGALGHSTRHQTYTTVEAVLRVFRARLSLRDAIGFAGLLPPVLRAIFVADWDLDEGPRPFADRNTLTREVRSLRRHHNFAPDTAIAEVGAALRRHVDAAKLDALLDRLPEGAAQFFGE